MLKRTCYTGIQRKEKEIIGEQQPSVLKYHHLTEVNIDLTSVQVRTPLIKNFVHHGVLNVNNLTNIRTGHLSNDNININCRGDLGKIVVQQKV